MPLFTHCTIRRYFGYVGVTIPIEWLYWIWNGFSHHKREETLTPDGINMIEMPVRPTLDIMSTRHNISVLPPQHTPHNQLPTTLATGFCNWNTLAYTLFTLINVSDNCFKLEWSEGLLRKHISKSRLTHHDLRLASHINVDVEQLLILKQSFVVDL